MAGLATKKVRLQVIAKISGIGGHLIEKSGKDQWFTREVLGTERLFGHNLHLYKKAKT